MRVEVQPGSGIEIRCDDPRVPLDESNTCWKIAERVLAVARQGLKPPEMRDSLDAGLKARSTKVVVEVDNRLPAQGGLGAGLKARSTKVVIEIEKRLPVQGGLGAASSNAVATMLGLERELGATISG